MCPHVHRPQLTVWWPQILPLYAVIGLATFNMTSFMYKYFTGSTECNWDKDLRKTHDNQGITEHRVKVHNQRFGLMGPDGVNKKQVRVFPFNYIPMGGARGRCFACPPR